MRPIEFRGMRADTGEWVYGCLVVTPDGVYRIYLKPFDGASSNTWYEVIPETVGQFTGFTDIDGGKVFEGDIILSDHWKPKKYKVIFDGGEFCFISINEAERPYTNSIHYVREFKIIGTIHDAPPTKPTAK